MYVATPFMIGSADFRRSCSQAAIKKWAAPGTRDRLDLDGRVRHRHERPADAAARIQGTPTTKTILAAFKSGQQPPELHVAPLHVRRAGDRQGATAICNDYYLIAQIKNGS